MINITQTDIEKIQAILAQATQDIQSATLVQVDLMVSIKRKLKKHEPKVVLQLVAKECGVADNAMISQSRERELFEARVIACKIFHLQGYTLKEIARHINRKDHTTILHALKEFDNLRRDKAGFYEKSEACLKHYQEFIDPASLSHFFCPKMSLIEE
ncbi:MAG: helix-turn-helix domain-containing protein [Bacteroidota bacterium]